MDLKIRRLTDDDKRQICAWKYGRDYVIYHLPSYEEMQAKQSGFMNPKSESNYLAFWDEDVLVGFVKILEEDSEVFIGIGVNPVMCGKHYGRRMLEQAYMVSKKKSPDKPLYLQVRTWNTGAVKCYENAGFRIDGEPFELTIGIGTGSFYRMTRS